MTKHRVFSGPYFLVFGLNTRKYGPQKTPYLDTFLTVLKTVNLVESSIISNKVLNKHKDNNSTDPWTATFFTKGSWDLGFKFLGSSYHVLCYILEKCNDYIWCHWALTKINSAELINLLFWLFNSLIQILTQE